MEDVEATALQKAIHELSVQYKTKDPNSYKATFTLSLESSSSPQHTAALVKKDATAVVVHQTESGENNVVIRQPGTGEESVEDFFALALGEQGESSEASAAPLPKDRSCYAQQPTLHEKMSALGKFVLAAPYFIKDLAVLCVEVDSNANPPAELIERTVESLPFRFKTSQKRREHRFRVPTVHFEKAVPPFTDGKSWCFELEAAASDSFSSTRPSPGPLLRPSGGAASCGRRQASREQSPRARDGGRGVAPELDPELAKRCRAQFSLLDDELLQETEAALGLRKILARDLRLCPERSIDDSVELCKELAGLTQLCTLKPGQYIKLRVFVGFGYGDIDPRFVSAKIAIAPRAEIKIHPTPGPAADPVDIEDISRILVLTCPQKVFALGKKSDQVLVSNPGECNFCMKCTHVTYKETPVVSVKDVYDQWHLRITSLRNTPAADVWREIHELALQRAPLP
jgi:hypothetical protein